MLNRHARTLHDQSTIAEFLDWLESKGMFLNTAYVDVEEFSRLDDLNPDRLIQRYFGIDVKQLDRERRQLLNETRQLVTASTGKKEHE